MVTDLRKIAAIDIFSGSALNTPLGSLRISTAAQGPPGPPGPPGTVETEGTDQWIKLYGKTMAVEALSNMEYNTSGCLISADVIWPDGSPGVYTGTPDSLNPEVVASYTLTYIKDGVTKTLSQSVERDTEGNPINIPAATIT